LRSPDNLSFEESSPKTGSSAFYKTKTSSLKWADLRDVFKMASKSVCTPADVIPPDPLSPTPSTSSPLKTPKITEETLMTPEPADGDI
jgi:hypothetical protein